LVVVLLGCATPLWPAAEEVPGAFTDELIEAVVWRASESEVRLVTDPAPGIDRALEWVVTTQAGRVNTLERELPVRPDAAGVIHFRIHCGTRAAVEVQLAGSGDARLYHIVQLDGSDWHDVSVPIARMARFGGFTDDMLAGPLALRFWIDGAPGWAGGAHQPMRQLTFTIADIRIDAPLAGRPEGVGALIEVDPSHLEGRIDPNVYGHFLEHIYHSVGDGLCGELIRNRSFVPPAGGFELADGVLTQTSPRTDEKLLAGDPQWTDYEFSLRARKTGGQEGFLILVRAASDDDFYWWNLGGWGNTQHALECEVAGARRVITEPVRGAIEPDRWYAVRVRVEGDRIEGWLDGEKLLDARDVSHPRGGVGLGTWATQAEFAGMRVRDSAGRELPLAFEPPVQEQRVPEFWEPVPVGAPVSQTRTDSPNTGWSVRVELAGPREWRGIRQGRIHAVAEHRFVGRAWLRHEGLLEGAKAVLRGASGSVISECRFSPPPGEGGWTECRFELAATVDDPEAWLEILGKGYGTLWVDQVSLMRDDSIGTGCRRDLLEAVRNLQPPIIRWPGGCFASIYRWKSSVGPQNERKPFYNAPWGEWDDASFGTDEFIRLCREVGAEPLIVLNLGSWDSPSRWEEYLQEAVEWVEYLNGGIDTPMGRLRARNGHPEPYGVKHFELDNETWSMGVEAYAERLIPFARAVRERCPDATIYACTFWEAEDGRLLERVGADIDRISYHLYDSPDNFAAGPSSFEAIWSRYANLVAASPNPNVGLAVTEWNAQSTDWRTGLFCGGLLNVMERQRVVRMASPALLLRRVDATDWDNAFINHDHRGWFPAPNYVVMRLYREHFQPNRVALEVTGTLDAVATVDDAGNRLVLKVVNADAKAVDATVRLGGGFSPRSGTAWTVRAGLRERNTLDRPNRIGARAERLAVARGEFGHRFPAYSVTVLELDR